MQSFRTQADGGATYYLRLSGSQVALAVISFQPAGKGKEIEGAHGNFFWIEREYSKYHFWW